MSGAAVAYLFDVDNTLLDNDRVREDLADTIDRLVGPERGRRFWEFYEEIRSECDYVDSPHALERFAGVFPHEPGFAAMADRILSYPSRTAVYPQAHAVFRRVGSTAPVAILSDDDPVY